MVSARNMLGGAGRTWPVVTVTVCAVLVPTAFLVWFMNAAMTSERLAVRQRLADFYTARATEIAAKIDRHWAERDTALMKAASGLPPAQAFAKIVRDGLADSVLILDSSGNVAYPLPPQATSREQTADDPGWDEALRLEYEEGRPEEAANAFATLALQSTGADSRSRAIQAEARCFVEAESTGEAIAALDVLISIADLAKARDSQGAPIGPNALLLALELTSSSDKKAAAQYATTLAKRLDDYSGADMAPGQRLFLMEELTRLVPDATLPTLGAEREAAYCESFMPLPYAREGAFQSRWITGLVSTKGFLSSDRRVLALLNGDGKPTLYESRSSPLFPAVIQGMNPHPAGMLISEGAYADVFSTDAGDDQREYFVSVPIGARVPGWRVGTKLTGDLFDAASRRQVALYLWGGLLGIVLIGAFSFVAARYVSRQMRLTRLKNDFVATVSHELKTPLASMRVFVDTLLDGRVEGEAQAKEYLGLIAKENERLSRLIDNFLTFSRMERNKQTFEREEIAPGEIVAAAGESVKERCERPGCKLTIDVARDLPGIIGDKGALVTVLVNLLDNAYKYSGDEKEIAIRVFAEEGKVCFSVADNGVGISRRDRKRIFERFYQADQSLSRAGGGCGLGLAIVKFIVDAHGGTIDVASEPGKGSVFAVRLPAARGGAAQA